MFISKSLLQKKFDVHPDIAAFFVDRKVPASNRYWKERLLYVSRGTGYLFIPLYFDLQYRCGLPLEIILDEQYVLLHEAILHSAALHESEEITSSEHIIECQELLNGRIIHEELYRDLVDYLSAGKSQHKYLGTGNKALNRGDTLLFALCALPGRQEVVSEIIKCWYALVPSFLLIDDIIDLDDDKEMKQENSILEFGPGTEGIKEAIAFLERKIEILAAYNPHMKPFFGEALERKLQTAYLKSVGD